MNKLPDTILVTGAGGVLGRELVERLIKREKCHIIALELTKKNLPIDFSITTERSVMIIRNGKKVDYPGIQLML